MNKPIKSGLRFIRNFIYGCFTIISIIWVIIILLSIITGVYMTTKIIPMVEEAKIVSFDNLANIKDTTFKHLSDTVIYDKNGEVISEINIGNYEYIDFKDLSPYIIEGYIAVEDKNFKLHNGVDYKAIIRAAISIVKNKGKITQGGSTITQQLVKNTMLTSEKTLERKAIEFFLAQELEKEYNKGQIMEFYVNTIFYGNNCYGIETASKYYFGKSAKDLNIEEAALLIGMSNNATYYNPLTRPYITKDKRDWVLSVMLSEGVITEEQYQESINKEFDFVLEREERLEEDYLISYAIYNATKELMKIEGFNFKYLFDNKESYDTYKKEYSKVYAETAERIRQGGFKIYTSLDREKQAILQAKIDEHLSYSTEKQENGKYSLQGAAVLINNETGYVEAIVGGRGEDNFNRGFLAVRQPGSVIKPIVSYGPAYDTLEYYPSYKYEDKYTDKGPKNYNNTYIGKVSLRDALARSINTVAFNLLGDIGVNKGLEYLANMEFDTLSYIDKDNGAIALGGFTYGVRVVDLAKSYYTIYNNGVYTDQGCVMKIESEEDGVIYNKDHREKVIYSPDTAYMVLDSLIACVEKPYGLSRSRAIRGIQTGSKSGTTNSQKDVWFSGMSPYYTLSVWVGYDTPKSTGTYGSGLPGVIWQNIMVDLHKDITNPKKFSKPPTIIELPINWEGKVVNYNTGMKDIFSMDMVNLEDRVREQERLEQQLIFEEKIREQIEEGIREIENFILLNYDDVMFLEEKERELIREIEKIEINIELKNELLELVDNAFRQYDLDVYFIKLEEENKKEREESHRAEMVALLVSIDSDLNYIEKHKDNPEYYPDIDILYNNLIDKIERIDSGEDRLNRLSILNNLYSYIQEKQVELNSEEIIDKKDN